MAEAQHHARRLTADLPSGTHGHVLGLKGRQQNDLVGAGEPAGDLPVQFVHQVDDALSEAGLCMPHPATALMVGFGIGAADQVVQMVAQSLDAPKSPVANLAAVGFGEVREKGANAGVERYHAITTWGLDVALRRVRNHQPVQATFLHQSTFLLPRRDGLGHPQRS